MVSERLNFRQNCQAESKKNTNLVENLKEMNLWFTPYELPKPNQYYVFCR
jgi:hypothetical protein